MSGATPWQRFRHVELPMARPALLGGAGLVFTASLGFYVVPAILGGPSDQMIGYFIAFYSLETLNPSVAASFALVLVALAGILSLLFGRMLRHAGSEPSGGASAPVALTHASILPALLGALMLVLPAVALAVRLWSGGDRAAAQFRAMPFEGGWLLMVANSVSLSALVALCACLIATGAAMVLTETRRKGLLVALLIVPLAVPQIVSALALLNASQNFGIPSTLVLVAGLAAHALPFALIPVASTVAGLDQRIVDAARLDGARDWPLLLHIILPQIRPALAAGFLLAFVVTLGDAPLQVFLGTPSFPLLSWRIWHDVHYSFETALASAAWLGLLSIPLSGIAWLAMKRRRSNVW